MTTRNIRQLFVAVALAASAIGVARAEDDESKECSVATLRGLYVFAASGFHIVNGVAQPKAIVEEILFDGQGKVTVPAVTVSLNGTIITNPQHPAPGSSGTYTVDANCTGTLTFNDGPKFDLFVAPSSSQVQLIQTNQDQVLQGTVVRVRRD